jgi:hypothetical protein
MYQGTQGYSLMKKTEGRKSRDTVSLINLRNSQQSFMYALCAIFAKSSYCKTLFIQFLETYDYENPRINYSLYNNGGQYSITLLWGRGGGGSKGPDNR